MSVMAMPNRTWRELVKAKRRKAIFRIRLVVRGREVLKEYKDEQEFRRWLAAFEQQKQRQKDGAIESISDEVIYP